MARPFKVQYETLSDRMKALQKSIATQTLAKNTIPDIITFCESPDYLGLKQVDEDGEIVAGLRPVQAIVLKVFYMGSDGNEHIRLTEQEIELCKSYGVDDGLHGDLLTKYNQNLEILEKFGKIVEPFRELTLVWGRRGGKTFLFSIIALYEAMRLLECPGGDPYKLYNIKGGAEISILTVASAAEQAARAFSEVSDKLLKSPYFADKYIKEGIGADTIYLLTPQDKQDNEDRRKKGIFPKKGSIVIEVGHSNSNSLRGGGIYVLLFDEIAAYKLTGGPSSDERLYTALEASVNTYKRKIKLFDEIGNPIVDQKGRHKTKMIYDGKIICISSPKGKEGKLWELYDTSPQHSRRVACRLPSWHVDPSFTEEDLRQNSSLSDDAFQQEYGAEFSGTAGSSFFPRECIERIFEAGRAKQLREYGQPGIAYFAHLDPARSNNNYALVVVHKEVFVINHNGKKMVDYKMVVDHVKFWHPMPGRPVRVEEVDNYMLGLKNRFFLAMVTYDQWNSADSIEKLKRFGIPSKCTKFNGRHIMNIFGELYNLVVGGKLEIPYHDLMCREMLALQKRPTASGGFRVYPKRDSDVNTDDLVTSLAGACYGAIQASVDRFPNAKIVDTGAMGGSSGQRLWQSMSGPIGYGTGQQVSHALEKIHSWPNWKRR